MHIYFLQQAMSDFEDKGLFLPGKPMDTPGSEESVYKDVLEEETDLFVAISQSSDLSRESKGIIVDGESQDFNSMQEKSNGVQVPESQSQVRGAHSLPQTQKSTSRNDIMNENE